jgi:6-phosphogluconolactonase
MLLGMGDDGHVASLFPDSPALALALDPAQPPGCIAMTAPVAPRERLSFNLRALLDSRRIAVLITGADKWATYQRAHAHGPALEMPVRALLRQQNVPVTVYWAP